MFAAPFFFYFLFSVLLKNNSIAKEFWVQENILVLFTYVFITLGFISAELFRNQVNQISEANNRKEMKSLKFETADDDFKQSTSTLKESVKLK